MGQKNFWVDVENQRLVRAFDSNLAASIPRFFRGDTDFITIYLLTRSTSNRIWDTIDFPAGGSVKFALGPVGLGPNAGVWAIKYDDSDPTADLLPSVNADSLQTALNSITEVDAAGGLTVAGPSGGPWQITWNTNGAREAFSFLVDALAPRSQAILHTVRAGDAETRQIDSIRLSRLPIAFQDDFVALPGAGLTVTRLQAGGGGDNEIQLLTMDPLAYGGEMAVIFSGASVSVGHSASAEEMRIALESLPAIGSGNVAVSRPSPGEWRIQFIGDLADEGQDLITASAVDLVSYTGRAGWLALNTQGVADWLAEDPRPPIVLEIEITDSEGRRRTQLQVPVTVTDDLIEGAPTSPTPFPLFLSAAESDARYIPQQPVDSNIRWIDGKLFLRETSPAAGWREVYLVNGAFTTGPLIPDEE